MNTNEMLHIVDLLTDLKPFFRGIFASNSLPFRVTRFPSAVVCNTDPLEEKGSHWIAFWFRNGTECEFYDSLGRLPEYYDIRLRDFIDINSFVMYKYNHIRLLLVVFMFYTICIAEHKGFQCKTLLNT